MCQESDSYESVFGLAQEELPTCAVCRVPVRTGALVVTGGGMSFVLECHGEFEVVDVPEGLFDNAVPWTITFQDAFQGQ